MIKILILTLVLTSTQYVMAHCGTCSLDTKKSTKIESHVEKSHAMDITLTQDQEKKYKLIKEKYNKKLTKLNKKYNKEVMSILTTEQKNQKIDKKYKVCDTK